MTLASVLAFCETAVKCGVYVVLGVCALAIVLLVFEFVFGGDL